jgi:release factor glutamine methyltransferase
MTVDEALALGAGVLPRRAGIPDPLREARWLLVAAWGVDELWLRLRREENLPADVEARYRSWLERRAAGEPAAHLSGLCTFWGREMAVSPAALVPRPETEYLVEAALDLCLDAGARVLDVGTGSGCIALSLAAERPQWRVFAVDSSMAAVRLARANFAHYQVAVDCLLGDLGTPLLGPFDLVVANLPYIPRSALPGLAAEVRRDPVAALDGGADGLGAIRRLIDDLPRLLAAHGWALLELGEGQAQEIANFAAANGLEERGRIVDAGGCERVLVLRR